MIAPGRPGGMKPDPYTSFKNDRDRLRALMSRDVRLVLCTCAVAIGAPHMAPPLINWLLRITTIS